MKKQISICPEMSNMFWVISTTKKLFIHLCIFAIQVVHQTKHGKTLKIRLVISMLQKSCLSKDIYYIEQIENTNILT